MKIGRLILASISYAGAKDSPCSETEMGLMGPNITDVVVQCEGDISCMKKDRKNISGDCASCIVTATGVKGAQNCFSTFCDSDSSSPGCQACYTKAKVQINSICGRFRYDL